MNEQLPPSTLSSDQEKKNSETPSTAEEFNEIRFWSKIQSAFRAAGEKAVFSSLVLYYTARSEDTPGWAKAVILGALGYFISLVDAIPDLTPILGYTDDLSIMIAAIGTIISHITPSIREKAKIQTEKLFGKPLDSSVIEIVQEKKDV